MNAVDMPALFGAMVVPGCGAECQRPGGVGPRGHVRLSSWRAHCLGGGCLRPVVACGGLPYRDSWSWAGFGPEFSDSAPWYFRTLDSWVELFAVSGLRLREVREPIHSATVRPASVVFIADAPD